MALLILTGLARNLKGEVIARIVVVPTGIGTGFVALGCTKVAVLDVVQGITELMPISSTAHMRILPALVGWPDRGPPSRLLCSSPP